MKKLLLLLLVLFGFTNCSNSDDSELVANYYIKYIAKAAKYKAVKEVRINTENGLQTITVNNSSWEQVIGPVTKDFEAKIIAYGTISNLEIHCCRGEEPFVLKASINKVKDNPVLHYSIDY